MQHNEINNLEVYTERMGKGLVDKLFFVDKIDASLIVDFGCADGLLIEQLNWWMPDVGFVGYDSDVAMIEKARERFFNKTAPLVFFSNDWEAVEFKVNSIRQQQGRTAVVLSSIVHEVYHYSEPHEVDAFWQKIFSGLFDYVIIRDMVPSRSVDRPSDINDITKIYRKYLNTKQLQDFENGWGSIENNKNLIHFLLKYKYEVPNWDREVKENYLPLFREDLLAMLPDEYNIIYHEHFVLPYIKQSVYKDLNIELKDPTHLKLILERANNVIQTP